MALYLIQSLLFVPFVLTLFAALVARSLRSRIGKTHVLYWCLPLLMTLPACFLFGVLPVLGEFLGPVGQDTAFADIAGWIAYGSLVMAEVGFVLLPLMMFISILGWIDSKTISRRR